MEQAVKKRRIRNIVIIVLAALAVLALFFGTLAVVAWGVGARGWSVPELAAAFPQAAVYIHEKDYRDVDPGLFPLRT